MNEPTQALEVLPRQMALDAQGRKAALDELLNKVALVMEVMDGVMKEGEHYGTIPGCGEKKVLLKSGAEKLGMTFHLKPSFEVSERDYPNMHREYRVTCTLSDGTQGVGTCSTLEAKYRYRAGSRKCPKCGKETIIKGKAEYGGGWLCFAKKGGCGAKWPDGATEIESQNADKVEHDNPADFWNTCLKMGKKRAHVDAVITSTACSDIFTQDIEETIEAAEKTTLDVLAEKAASSGSYGAESRVYEPEPPSQAAPHPPTPRNAPSASRQGTPEAIKAEYCKARFLHLVKNEPVKFAAWVWGCESGVILNTERLEDGRAFKFPNTKELFDSAMKRIKEIADAPPDGFKQSQYAAAYIDDNDRIPGAEVPGPTKSEAPGSGSGAGNEAVGDLSWRNYMMHIPPKGVKKADYEPVSLGTLYDLAEVGDEGSQKRLFGQAKFFEPKPWTNKFGKTMLPSEEDKALRRGLDLFNAWHENKKAREKGVKAND